MVQETPDLSSHRCVRWTPEADKVLVDLVQECEFDFKEVAARLSTIFTENDADMVDGGQVPTADDCRVRYTELDMLEGTVGGGEDDSEAKQGEYGGRLIGGNAVGSSAMASVGEILHDPRGIAQDPKSPTTNEEKSSRCRPLW